MSVFPDLVDEEEDDEDMHRLAQLIATYVCIAHEQAANRVTQLCEKFQKDNDIGDDEAVLYHAIICSSLFTERAYKDTYESYVSVLREMGVKGV
jgi:hypothetical protein